MQEGVKTEDGVKTERAADKTPVFTLELPVLFSDTDMNGHVNNMHFNSYCDEATMNMMKVTGYDLNDLVKSGTGPVIVKAEYEYAHELKHGDIIRIETTITFTSKIRALFEHTIFSTSTGEVVCRARTHGLWMDLETRRPMRAPAGAKERLMMGPQ